MAAAEQGHLFQDNTGRPLESPPGAIRPGVCAVTFNAAGEVLLEKRSDNGFWGLPGGAVEIGESVQDAVVREVREETGLHVTITRLVGIYSDPNFHTISRYPDGNVVHWVTVCFECERRSGELAISEESTDIGYFPADSLPEQTLLAHRMRIQHTLARRAEPYIQ